MIHRLRGPLLQKGLTTVVVDAGGVGYGVTVSPQLSGVLPDPPERVDLFIHTHVYEGGIDLFGFRSAEDRSTFLLLTSVSKVGPRMAMNILAGMEPDVLVQTLAEGDLARLVRVPGVGKKTAERMVVELKDRCVDLWRQRRLAAGAAAEAGADAPPPGAVLEDVRSALLNFGWKPANVNRIMPLLQKESDEGAALQDLIREGLRLLQGQ